MSWVETIAALLAVVYLWLTIKQWRSCWAAALISSCLYVWVLAGARLYMEAALNAFYAAMAIYGYWQWSRTGAGRLGVSRGSARQSGSGLIGTIVLSCLSSFFLRRYTPAAWPFVDSMVTWASVFATFLVARKIYSNWHWWLVIDSISLCLFASRGLYLTTLLYVLYLIMIVIGMRQWRRDLRAAADAVA